MKLVLRALLALLLLASAARAEITAVGPLAFTIADADRSAAFLRDVLDFESVSDVEVAGEAVRRLTGVFGTRLRVVTLRLGSEEVELHEYLAPRGRAFPEDTRGNDRWFQHAAIVVSDMAKAYAKLRAHDVAHASTGPQRLPDWNANAAGIEAFYFRDPDGHLLELIAFPKGKGDPRWQRASGYAQSEPALQAPLEIVAHYVRVENREETNAALARAERDYRTFTERYPTGPVALSARTKLVQTILLQERFDEAIAELLRISDSTQGNPQAAGYMVEAARVAQQKLGNSARAAEILDQIAVKYPNMEIGRWASG